MRVPLLRAESTPCRSRAPARLFVGWVIWTPDEIPADFITASRRSARRVSIRASRRCAADEPSVSRLAQNVQQGRAVIRESVTHAEASMDFHVELARAAGNEVLYATVAAYRELLVPALRDLRNPSTVTKTQRVHEELVEAVRRRDAEGARELMVTHLEDFEKRLRRRLAEREEERLPTGNIHRLIRSKEAKR